MTRPCLVLRNFLLRISLIGLASGLPALAASTENVLAIAQAVDRHYNHLRSFQADFVETYTGAGTERTESGTLWLKKPGKMRWDYRSPRVKLFLSDGKESWFYVPGEQQVRKISAHQLEDLRSPLAFLLGKSRLEKELKGLSVATDISPLEAGRTILRGVPAGMEDRVSEVVLEITPDYKISRIVLHGTDGSVTEYRFSSEEGNVPIPDQQFHFVPPPGIEIIEGDVAQ